jgi:hypothetical protein
MKWFKDIHNRKIRVTDGRLEHFETVHPEMFEPIGKIEETLLKPDIVIKSKTDSKVELFYRHYDITPVTEKFLCVVVKVLLNDLFIITAYFTDTKKGGEVLWRKK